MSRIAPLVSRLAPFAFFGALALLLVFTLLRPRSPEPRFAPPEAPSHRPESPQAPESFDIETPGKPAIVHVASLAPLPGGGRIVVFYGGSGEMTSDSRLFLARFDGRRWEPARVLFTPEEVSAAEHRWVRALGNPLLFGAPRGELRLLFVSASIGGWSGASLNASRSTDGGRSWSPPTRVPSSPLLDRSTLVRGAAAPLDDGGFLVPAYHELGTKIPVLLRFDRNGELVGRRTASRTNGLFQPATLPLDATRGLLLLRDHRNRPGWIHRLATNNGGLDWTPAVPTTLQNPDSAVALARLDPGTLLLAWNSSPTDRSILSLSVSSDEGTTWERRIDIENRPGGSFSYPSLVVDGELIDVVYTAERTRIRHLRLSRGELERRGGAHVGR